MTSRHLAGLAALAAIAGCYTYRPMAQPEPVAGQHVSAQLTSEGSRALAAQVGPDVLHVEGEVVRIDSAGLELAVRQVESYRGIQASWNGERVRVPRGAIAGIQERRFSLGGTGLVGGLVVGGLYAIYAALGAGSTGGSGSGSGGGGPQ